MAIQVGLGTYGHERIRVFSFGSSKKLLIGNFCSIASNVVVFLGGNHLTSNVTTFPFGWTGMDIFGEEKFPGHPSSNGDVKIGSDCWIGYGSTIMSGISIGDGAVLAANSHVHKDVPPFAIVGGNPAKILRYRFPPDICARLLEIKWWNYDLNKVKKIKSLLSTTCTHDILNQIENELGL